MDQEGLLSFAEIFEGDTKWARTKCPTIHESTQIEVLKLFQRQKRKLAELGDKVSTTKMWDETNSQKNGILKSKIEFPESVESAIFAGAYCSLANPFFQTVRSKYNNNSDYDVVDLNYIDECYLPRTKYVACQRETFTNKIPKTNAGSLFNESYMLVNREFVGTMSERTLIGVMLPPRSTFMCTLFGMTYSDLKQMVCLCGCENSIPFDFLVKVIGKNHVGYQTIKLFPLFSPDDNLGILLRTLLLNCLSVEYKSLWDKCWSDDYKMDRWAKDDVRLNSKIFMTLSKEWNRNIPLRTDYQRREALVELDVLTAMALGMSLKQLMTIYRIQFPVLQSYEAYTWYDRNGRIVFTNNRALTNVGLSRNEWEEVKDKTEGTVTQVVTDDTMPGGPVERTIEYVAPFDRCDREKDYEEVWANFEKRFSGGGKS